MKKIIIFFIFTFAILIPDIRDCFGQTITFQKAILYSNIEYLRSVVQTPDDGYIAVGRRRESFANDYTYIVRFNQFGDTVWTRKINRDEAVSVIKTYDGNYALIGLFGGLIKFNINGDILFISSYFDEEMRITKILQAKDNSFFVCGYYHTGGNLYPYLFKYDLNGNFLWDTVYTTIFFSGVFMDMIFDENDNLILTGYFKPTINEPNGFFIMNLNSIGSVLLLNGITEFFYPSPRCIVRLNSGGYIVGGIYNDNDAFLSKFDINGNFEWLKGYDTTTFSISYSIVNVDETAIVYTGFINVNGIQKVRVRKTDTNGVEIWEKLHGFPEKSHSAWNLKETTDSGFVIVGRVDFQDEDCYILKIDKNGELLPPFGINLISEKIPNSFKLDQNFPNPFNPMTKIRFDIAGNEGFRNVKIIVTDILGREVSKILESKLRPGRYEFEFFSKGIASGVYFYSLISDDLVITKKMIINK